ncbi:MAG: hypothetical protein ACOYNI_01780 [Acidimicrobiia bacterium]
MFTPTTVERATAELARELRAQGHTVFVDAPVTGRDGPRFAVIDADTRCAYDVIEAAPITDAAIDRYGAAHAANHRVCVVAPLHELSPTRLAVRDHVDTVRAYQEVAPGCVGLHFEALP